MKRIGITGVAGFIGSHLADRLLEDGYQVIGVDDLSYGAVGNLDRAIAHDHFEFAQIDCSRTRTLRAAFDGCDGIVHLAARKIPRYSGTLATLEGNVSGFRAASEVALDIDADIILASTSDVYGFADEMREDGPIVLGPPTTKRWSYAASKLYDEFLALALADEHGLPVSILRFFNCYGPRQHRSWWGGAISAFAEDLLDGRAMEIHGDGQQQRSFTYVADTVDGIVRTLRTPESRGEVINIGSDQTISILELAGLVQLELGIPMPIRASFTPYADLPGNYQDVQYRRPDMTKAQSLLGFSASVPLEEGVRRSVDWHRGCRESVQTAVSV